MADTDIKGLKVAILVTDGFEQVELVEPRKALDAAGAETAIVSPKEGKVRGWNFTDWGDEQPVDMTLADARPEDFDALLLPGGVINPDTAADPAGGGRVRAAFFDAGKPVASICHGPWTLIEAGAVRGRRMASWPSLADRPRERRRGVGGPGSRGGRQPGLQPKARRHPGLQPRDDQPVRPGGHAQPGGSAGGP